ncbi:site-specific integrase [Shewanella sp. UCD-KL21]|uniref:tyrosine-type recombinase/integrase n=1 Tax=Shewanella sp. UCD-KL21 TaxID=1917164 RepID=UPI0009708970|nr:site-specific integrase [Shewanella sp. UCD-KL21]
MASIKQRPNGRFQAQVRLSGHKPTSKVFNTEHEAITWAESLESQLTKLTAPDATVKSIGTILLDNLKPETKDKYQYRLNPLISFFGNRPIDTLTSLDFNAYIKHRGVSGGTVRGELQYLSRIIKYARQHGIVLNTCDPFKDYTLPAASKPRTRVLNESEYNRILIDISPNLMPMVALAWHTSMRRSEVLALTVDCIDFDKRTLHLAHTKNGESRDVPLNRKAIQVLQSVVTNHDHRCKYLFDIKPQSLSRGFKRSCDRLGIDNVCFHSLRHSAATRYANAGLTPLQLKAVTGHKDMRSLARYTHIKASDVVHMLDC